MTNSNEQLDLTIKDLTSSNFKYEQADPRLFRIPSGGILVVGRSGCGKTNVIKNWIEWHKKFFKDRIICLCESLDDNLKEIETKYGGIVMTEPNNPEGKNVIQNLINYQLDRKARGKKLQNYLVYLEDWINHPSFDKKRSIYGKLFSQGRHLRITTIMSVQQYTLTPANLRRQCQAFILFKISNTSERKICFNELCNTVDMSEQDFETVYNHITQQPFGFMVIDCHKAKWSNQFNGQV